MRRLISLVAVFEIPQDRAPVDRQHRTAAPTVRAIRTRLRRRCALIRPLIRRVEIATAIPTQLPSPGLRRTLIGPAIVLIEITAAVVAKLPPSGSSRRRSRCCHEADDQQEQRNHTSACEPHVAPTSQRGRRRAECNCIAGAVADGAVRAGDPIRCAACALSRSVNEHEATVNARRDGQAVSGGTIIAERCQKPVATRSAVLQIRDSTVLCLRHAKVTSLSRRDRLASTVASLDRDSASFHFTTIFASATRPS